MSSYGGTLRSPHALSDLDEALKCKQRLLSQTSKESLYCPILLLCLFARIVAILVTLKASSVAFPLL